MMAFIEQRIGTGDVSLTVRDGTTHYTVKNTDMLQSWYGAWMDDVAQATGEELMKQAREAEQRK